MPLNLLLILGFLFVVVSLGLRDVNFLVCVVFGVVGWVLVCGIVGFYIYVRLMYG